MSFEKPSTNNQESSSVGPKKTGLSSLLAKRISGALVAMSLMGGAVSNAHADERPPSAPRPENGLKLLAQGETQFGTASFSILESGDGDHTSKLNLVNHADSEYQISYSFFQGKDEDGAIGTQSRVLSEGTLSEKQKMFKFTGLTPSLEANMAEHHRSPNMFISGIKMDLDAMSQKYAILQAFAGLKLSNSPEYKSVAADIKKSGDKFSQKFPDYQMPAEFAGL